VADAGVVIVAPFWPWPGHVGVYRVERFVRWCAGAGRDVVLVRAGRTDGVEEREWGRVVRVADPLRFFPDDYDAPSGSSPRRSSPRADAPARRPRVLKRLASLALAPDPSVLWSIRAARHRLVRDAAARAAWVISSSPPESAHVAALLLARAVGARLAIDLRDGWLDEPQRPEMRHAWRRALEGWIERRVLARADRVFVTSDGWREPLERRRPEAHERVAVLTNAYPPPSEWPAAPVRRSADGTCRLLYAGRFAGSRLGWTAERLLRPLADGLRASPVRGTLTILGELSDEERRELVPWCARLASLGWTLEHESPVPRRELLRRCLEADGLLLSAPSTAVVSSKLFEYIPARRPVLAVTPAGGAVARILADVPQGVFLDEHAGATESGRVVSAFLERCMERETRAAVPPAYSEEQLGRRFLDALGLSLERSHPEERTSTRATR
jgi:hypothetical protein